jgi:hypothetical protein
MFKAKSLPEMRIKNGMQNNVRIHKKFDVISLFSHAPWIFKLIVSLMVITSTYLSINYAKMLYEESQILQEKMLSNVTGTESEEGNMILETFRNIIVREGGLDKGMATNYAKWIFDNAYKHKVDPLLILAVISVESKFDYKAVSGANAVGLMQVIYIWHKEKVSSKADLFDPKTNIGVGTKILREYLDRSSNEVEALLRYNGSLGQSPIYAIKVAQMKQKFNFEILRKFNQKV